MELLGPMAAVVSGKDWMDTGILAHLSSWASRYAILVIPTAVVIITQLVKLVIYSIKNGWKLERILMYGHMPSAHTALVVSLPISFYLFDGFSTAFVLSFFFALVVIDDAVHFRMHVGEQGRYLNAVARKLGMNEKKFPILNERVGHRNWEAIIGAILGVILTLVFAWIL